MKDWLKSLALAVLGEYAIYKVWRLDSPGPRPPADAAPLQVRPLEPADFDAPGVTTELASSHWYQGAQSCGFGCFENDQLLAIAFYWWEQRYARRGSWPIEAHAAKLVHIVTAPAARGRGVAALLIQASAAAMQAQGRMPLYARIWHSNLPSQRAFARAGWRPCGWLLQINPLRLARPWTLRCREAVAG